MDLYTSKKVSPKGKINKRDLKKIARDTVIFFAPACLVYLGQLQGDLARSGTLALMDLVPSSVTLGAIYGWGLGIAINFFLRFQSSSE